FKASRLNDPERLIVDLPNVRWQIRPSAQSKPRGMARDVHFGERAPGQDRLIVAIDEPFKIVRTITLEPDRNVSYYRLVVDIEPQVLHASEPPATASSPAPTIASAAPRPAPSTVIRPILRPPLDADAFTAQRRPIIVLDPGHGGRDPGAIGINGVYERNFTLAMGQSLARLLSNTGRYEVVLTRDDNRFITLPGRIEIAREAGGDLFISLHADSIGKSKPRGASVYTLSETASDAEAAKLAQKENKAGIINGADLSNQDEFVTSILIDLAQRDTNNKSIEFAELLVSELGDATELVKETRRYAGFAVLKAPDIPSVLVELGYLSNAEEAELLSDKNHRDKLAHAILAAIDDFFDTSS
ncbi:MAG: N-acetylmuramoyl-L-alanine amidase, partial [Pseudomonadota bacterium]